MCSSLFATTINVTTYNVTNRQMEKLAKDLEKNPQKLDDEAYGLAMEEARIYKEKISKRNQDKANNKSKG